MNHTIHPYDNPGLPLIIANEKSPNMITDGKTVFCSPPAGAICTTCTNKLDVTTLGNYGGKPAVVLMKKKKIKKGKKGLSETGSPCA